MKKFNEKLESFLERHIESLLKNYETPENFLKPKVDIFENEYGKHCHLHFTFKKPFSGGDSEILMDISRVIKKHLKNLLPLKMDISSNNQTIDMYDKDRDWYNELKKL